MRAGDLCEALQRQPDFISQQFFHMHRDSPVQICIPPAHTFLAMLQQHSTHLLFLNANLYILMSKTRSTGCLFSFARPSVQPISDGHNVPLLPLPPWTGSVPYWDVYISLSQPWEKPSKADFSGNCLAATEILYGSTTLHFLHVGCLFKTYSFFQEIIYS